MALFEELEIKLQFPEIKAGQFEITSPRTKVYNCIAWAAGDDTRWWWPDQINYWPQNAPRKRTTEAFISMFQQLGYAACANADSDPEFEKIAIFTGPSGTPTHAARQESNGKWTSKLGNSNDIRHELIQVGGFRSNGYGNVAVIMQRKRGAGSQIFPKV